MCTPAAYVLIGYTVGGADADDRLELWNSRFLDVTLAFPGRPPMQLVSPHRTPC